MEGGSRDTKHISLGVGFWDPTEVSVDALGYRSGLAVATPGFKPDIPFEVASWRERRYIPSSLGSGGQGARPCGVECWELEWN